MYVCSGHICSTCIVWVHNEKQNKSLTFICQVHEKNKNPQRIQPQGNVIHMQGQIYKAMNQTKQKKNKIKSNQTIRCEKPRNEHTVSVSIH